MFKKTLNICQVSLNSNIPLIIENYKNFKKIYKKIKVHVICPQEQLSEFQYKLNFEDVEIINEDKIIAFNEFNKIFKNLSASVDYQDQFEKRLSWYYQQILKISFAINFIKKNNENLVIWDADTIILKEIRFFDKDHSLHYGNLFEYHKAYYSTNEGIFGNLPKYFISFLNQFIAISENECNFFIKNFPKIDYSKDELGRKISEYIIQIIFNKHKVYNGSLFSEYELIGQSNYEYNKSIQKPLLFLRFGLDGKLTNLQKKISVFLGYKHVTYEHTHPNFKNTNMLDRSQNWIRLVRLFIRNFFKFYLRYIKHILLYNYYK